MTKVLETPERLLHFRLNNLPLFVNMVITVIDRLGQIGDNGKIFFKIRTLGYGQKKGRLHEDMFPPETFATIYAPLSAAMLYCGYHLIKAGESQEIGYMMEILGVVMGLAAALKGYEAYENRQYARKSQETIISRQNRKK